jgi:hypothetical protein
VDAVLRFSETPSKDVSSGIKVDLNKVLFFRENGAPSLVKFLGKNTPE